MENSFIIRFWIAKSMRTLHVVLAVIAVAAHVIASISGKSWLFAFSDTLALFAILHFFIHSSLHRRYCFLTDHLRVYALPKKKISQISSRFLLAFLISACIAMALARELYRGTLIKKLRLLFMYILQKLLGGLIDTGGLDKEGLLVQNDQSLLDTLSGIAARSEQPWEKVVDYIQTIIVLVGLALLVALILYFIVRAIRRAISSGRAESPAIRIRRETQEQAESLTRGKTQRERLLDFSPNARVRRLYRHRINRSRRRGQMVSVWLTPSEIETEVSLPKEDAYLHLHRMYEKARYSENGCTAQEAEQLKSLKL